MDFKKILNTITGEKGEELLNELKEKSGGLQDMLQEKLKDKVGQGTDEQADGPLGGLGSVLQGKLKDFAENAKSEIESKIKK